MNTISEIEDAVREAIGVTLTHSLIQISVAAMIGQIDLRGEM